MNTTWRYMFKLMAQMKGSNVPPAIQLLINQPGHVIVNWYTSLVWLLCRPYYLKLQRKPSPCSLPRSVCGAHEACWRTLFLRSSPRWCCLVLQAIVHICKRTSLLYTQSCIKRDYKLASYSDVNEFIQSASHQLRLSGIQQPTIFLTSSLSTLVFANMHVLRWVFFSKRPRGMLVRV